MKNTGGNSQDWKINSERIRTASSRQQLSQLNFKVDALRSSNTLVTGNLFGGNFSDCFFHHYFLNYNLWVHVWDRERLSIPQSTQKTCPLPKKPAPFQNDGHLRGLRASRPVSKDNCRSNAPGHFCSIPSHSLLQHNSCRGKERPLEKELLPQLDFSLGVPRSGDHSENAALSLNWLHWRKPKSSTKSM